MPLSRPPLSKAAPKPPSNRPQEMFCCSFSAFFAGRVCDVQKFNGTVSGNYEKSERDHGKTGTAAAAEACFAVGSFCFLRIVVTAACNADGDLGNGNYCCSGSGYDRGADYGVGVNKTAKIIECGVNEFI